MNTTDNSGRHASVAQHHIIELQQNPNSIDDTKTSEL
jgi:hypothetical protein